MTNDTTETPAKRPRLLSEDQGLSLDSGTPQDIVQHDQGVGTSTGNPPPAGQQDEAVCIATEEVTQGEDINTANLANPSGKGKGRETDFVPIHGNYRGYYGKRRLGQDPYNGDERLSVIPKEWLQDKRVLDVGCNSGKVTIEIAQRFGPYRVTGVDIDSELIRKAHRQSRIAWSTQEPLPTVHKAAKADKDRLYRRRRSPSRSPEPIDASEAFVPAPHHFPAALTRMFGFLPQLPSDKHLRQYVRPSEQESKERSQRRDGKRSRGNVMPKKVCLFPHNLAFKKADWVNEEITQDKRGYDCILALSVVKWIHLNGGDEGLKEFFTRAFMTLHPDGRFILEPQPWESYQKAARLSESLKQNMAELKIRPDDFEKILLEEIGFTSVEKLFDESGKGFKRPLHVYRRAAGSWL